MSAMPATPVKTNGSAGIKSSLPIDFSMYDENVYYLLYITDDPTQDHRLKTELKNTSNAVINFPTLKVNEADPWHFELRFRKGTLSDKTLNILRGTDQIKSLLSPDDQNNWAIGLDENSSGTKAYISLFVRSKGSAALNPGSSMILPLQHISADAGSGSRGTRVEFIPHQMKFNGDTNIQVNGNREQHLFITNHSGQKQIPLHVGFVGSNKILNDGAVHTGPGSILILQIRNIAKPSQEHYESTTIRLSKKSEIILSATDLKPTIDINNVKVKKQSKEGTGWVVKEDLNASFSKKDWAAGQGESQELTLTPKNEIALNPGDYIEIQLSGFMASPPAGLAHIYLNYNNIPGYWDGHFILTIEKTPLLFGVTNNVGISTADPLANLHVNGIVFLSDGSDHAKMTMREKYMQPGSLTIGSTDKSYGGELATDGKWTSNTAGLLLTTKEKTEIAVFDSYRRVASLLFYEGQDNYRITIGRDMGWGAAREINLNGKVDIQAKTRSGIHSSSPLGLYVTGDFGEGNNGVEFRHTNGTQGIGFGYNTIYATGENQNQDLKLKPRGTGKVEVIGSLKVNSRIQDETGYVMPVGTILAYVGSSAPDGWLICDGRAIPSDDKYKTLRDLIGNTNTPNLIGKTLVSAGGNYGLRTIGGEEKHALTVAEMPGHVHSINNGDFGTHHRSFLGGDATDLPYKTEADVNRRRGTDASGGGQAHNNMPPYYVVNYIIKY